MTALLEQAIAKMLLRALNEWERKELETPKPGRKAGSAKGQI